MLKKIKSFLQSDIWRLDVQELSRAKAFMTHHLRVFLAALQGFSRNDCSMRASSLTYYTLLSIVPVMALAFGIAKGFGLDDMLQSQLEQYLGAHEEIFDEVVQFSYSMLEVTRGGVIAGVGFLFLLWAVIKVLDHIELSFNAVWGVQEGRSWVRKFTEYLSVMVLAPVLVILSGSLTVFLTTEIYKYLAEGWLALVADLFQWGAQFTPYVIIWLLFTFLFMAMPNTRVNFKAALIAGIISGTMFQLLQWGYVNFQVGVVRYNAIYGSFAALPLFLVWLQLSWMIVLLGAELSYAYQNVRRFIYSSEIQDISPGYKEKVSLLVMHLIIKRFIADKGGVSREEVCEELKLPVTLVNQVLGDLYRSGLAVRVEVSGDEAFKYQPGKDVNRMSIAFVLKTLKEAGSSDVPVVHNLAWDRISSAMESFEKAMEKSPDNVLLKDIGAPGP